MPMKETSRLRARSGLGPPPQKHNNLDWPLPPTTSSNQNILVKSTWSARREVKKEDVGARKLADAKAKGLSSFQKGVFGGIYIPPFKLAKMMKECQDKTSQEYQRLTWDALRKSLNGIVNKVNSSNIREMLPEIFSEVNPN